MVKSCDRWQWCACTGAPTIDPGHARRLADLSSVNCRLSWLLPIANLQTYKIRSRNGRFSSLLGSKQPSNLSSMPISQLQDRDNVGHGFSHWSLSSLENPTDACSIVCHCNNLGDVDSYQKTAWDLHFKFDLTVCLG